jgi:hypothetical protein
MRVLDYSRLSTVSRKFGEDFKISWADSGGQATGGEDKPRLTANVWAGEDCRQSRHEKHAVNWCKNYPFISVAVDPDYPCAFTTCCLQR